MSPGTASGTRSSATRPATPSATITASSPSTAMTRAGTAGAEDGTHRSRARAPRPAPPARPVPELAKPALVSPRPLEQHERRACLLLVDPREREADVDEHPVADLDRRRGLVDERDADLPAHTGDVHLGEPGVGGGKLDDPSW